jgi:hypothetical protein
MLVRRRAVREPANIKSITAVRALWSAMTLPRGFEVRIRGQLLARAVHALSGRRRPLRRGQLRRTPSGDSPL